ncbi:hypothetical protein DV711_12245 [Motiliproteus coralliicola]|uniref:Uncharacterized protein n=1 Tax=Motiliproteus coralliicola TaxID=2283196 RepID=A0A369WGB0_9GAMM|nr:hypothetical protein DV711_12245 [Motiliproteus coralliicola]
MSWINHLAFRNRSLIAILLAVSTLFCGLAMASSVPMIAVGDEVEFEDRFEISTEKSATYPSMHTHCQPQDDSNPLTLADLPCWGSATLNSSLSMALDTDAAVVLDLDQVFDVATESLSLSDRIRAGPYHTAKPIYQAGFIPPSHRVLHCVLRL